MTNHLTRRDMLLRAGAVGCSLAASPLVTPMSFAATPWDNRLVVIILRGGLDGLDAVRPWGDGDLLAARPGLAADAQDRLDLDGFYGLHPAMKPLMPLWRSGELGFVHAVSQPYRDKRSHFDGQDLLEAGLPSLNGGLRDGWLNRMLQGVPGVTSNLSYAIGRENMFVLQGEAPVSRWTPEVDIGLSAQGLRLLDLTMQDDAEMAATMAQAIKLAEEDGDPVLIENEDDMMGQMAAEMRALKGSKGHERIADFAAQRLRADARIASFSLGGWDTHANQARGLKRAMTTFSETLLRLRDSLGPEVWGKTTVVAMTEFGRTVRENGSRGTDHGTGGAMILAGGAIRGGQVHGRWPGLAEADLYVRRDLMPTDDVRRWAAWAMRSGFGISRDRLERVVFPGLDLGDDPNMLL